MTVTFNPGNILVDETSLFGQQAHLPRGEAANFPDTARWLERVQFWLGRIAGTRVGRILLESMQGRPGRSGIEVRIVRMPRTAPDAFTDGIIAAGTPFNSSTHPVIFVSYAPQDARPGPINLDPMRQPGAVLVHELMHAYMAIHGLNTLTQADGSQRPIATWTSAAYPNHNEFCATTIQNMLLAETGTMLSDGYSADDPWIFTSQPASISPTAFGNAASTNVDTSGFVRSYRQPLDFLVNSLPTFTNRLAALTNVPFNPFAAMRGTGATGNTPARGGASGAARVPMPVDISPHD
jgi:hypothetical protein